MSRLKGKLAVVTGATRGIGKAIALRFAKEGATVIAIGQNVELGKKVEEEMNALKFARQGAPALVGHGVDCDNGSCDEGVDDRKCIFYALDVSNTADVNAFADKVKEDLGEIDILVNNAGITRDGLLMRMSEEDWDLVLATNLKSVYNLCKALVRQMIKKRAGRIINVSSISGIMANPGQTNYSASKAGVIGFTRSLSAEVAGKNVTVNAIAPGFIETDMVEQMGEDKKSAIVEHIPLKRLGKPDDIASAALFLASEEGNFITGQTIVVDGGMSK